MLTTTTKTLNYSITKGNNTNSVNATITSTPGCNTNYIGKLPGILKILELVLAIVALGLIASCREPNRLSVTGTAVAGVLVDSQGVPIPVTGTGLGTAAGTPVPVVVLPKSYWREMFLEGEVYFLCAHTAVITFLIIILGAYLFHTTSAMIIPKATTLENVANLVLALLLLAAGITEIVQTILAKHMLWEEGKGVVVDRDALRFAAGAIAILNALVFIGSFFISRKELAGPKTL